MTAARVSFVSLLLLCGLATPARVWSQQLVSAAEVFKKAEPSVAKLVLLDAKGEVAGSGSAFVVGENGLVATSYHNLVDKDEAWVARGARIELPGQSAIPVEGAVAFDAAADWAILKVSASALKTLPLGDAKQLEKGQPIVAIGFPAGLDARPTVGTFSGWYEGQLLHDASTSSGNSGGPLIDQSGNVVGISRGELRSTTNRIALNDLFFAVDISHVREALAKGVGAVTKLPLVAPSTVSPTASGNRGVVAGGSGGGGGVPPGVWIGVAGAATAVGTIVAVKKISDAVEDPFRDNTSFMASLATCSADTKEVQVTETGRFNVRLLYGMNIQMYFFNGRCQGTVTYANSSIPSRPSCGRVQQAGSCSPVQSGDSFVTDTLVPGLYTIVVHNSSSTNAYNYFLTFERQN